MANSNRHSFMIPATTELLGRKISVFFDSPSLIRSGNFGFTNLVNSQIHIATRINGQQVPRQEQEITYLHEIAHLIIAKNGYEKKLLRAGINLEALVEDIAVGYHQILTKAQFKDRGGKPDGEKDR